MHSSRLPFTAIVLALSAFVQGCSGHEDPVSSPEESTGEAASAALPFVGATKKGTCFVQQFTDVAWNVCVVNVGMKGIWISYAAISRSPSAPFVQVLGRSGPADVFTPYHDSSLRYYDMNQFWSANTVRVLNQADAPNGTLITLPGDAQPRVMKEVRDEGLAWLCRGNTSTSRRLRKLVLWSVYDAGNYDFVIEYGFGEDGKISFRTGATGYNSPPSPTMAHMHDTLWFINVDLNGPGNDTAYADVHFEPPNSLTATDFSIPFGVEGFWDRSDLNFGSVRVEDELTTNAFGNKIGYSLEPVQEGRARHYGNGQNGNAFPTSEVWTQHDYAVSAFHPAEMGWMAYVGPIPPYVAGDSYLRPILGDQTYVPQPAPPESTSNTDVALWHVSSAHHEPTDEDRPNFPVDPVHSNGVTLMHWHGCDLVPRNFFDYNPVGGPLRCDPVCGDNICGPGECCSCPSDCGFACCEK